jgi:uncharacterized membrane protein YeaQ/YmgE (transglycosylase-associated protein family)
MTILWTIIIGFVAGVSAKFTMPGDNKPSGFILTAILGIVGAFVATYLGQALGWYGPGQARAWSAPSLERRESAFQPIFLMNPHIHFLRRQFVCWPLGRETLGGTNSLRGHLFEAALYPDRAFQIT